MTNKKERSSERGPRKKSRSATRKSGAAVTGHRRTADVLRESEARYRSLFENMINGFAFHKIVLDKKGKPVDYVFLEVNNSFERLTGLKGKDIIGRRVTDVLPGIEKDPVDWIGVYGKVALTGKDIRFEQFAGPIGKWYAVAAYSPMKNYFVTFFEDITGRKQSEELLLQSENRLKRSQEIAHLGSWELDLISNRLYWSDEVYRIFGLQPQEFGATYEAFLEAVYPDDRAAVDAAYSGSLREGRDAYEIEHRVVRRSTGEIRYVHEKCEHIRDGSGRIIRSVGMVHDITEHKLAEERTKHLATFPSLNPNPVMETDTSGKITYMNPAIETILEDIGMDKNDAHVFIPDDFAEILRKLDEKSGSTVHREVVIKDRVFSSTIHLVPQFNVLRIYAHDITARKQVEAEILRAKEEWELTFNSVPDLIAILDLEHRIVRANRAMAARLGTSADKCVGLKCFSCVHGSSAPPDVCPHTLSLEDGREHSAELHEDRLGGDFLVTTTPMFDEMGRMTGSVHVARDITARKRAEEERERLLEELKRSNRELEQFAYIASHDLQEPLRTVSSYVQLVSRRYKDRLDGDANEFMNYAVSAAAHMRTLLNDLLAYSRVGSSGDGFELTDLNSVLTTAIANLKTAIDGSNAVVEHESLPAVYLDKVQLVQVFQNLISNAIKFRDDKVPRIHVSAERQEHEWLISVSDNGIGINPDYFDRIFNIFKRLHPRERFDGTGIGLAICKKIIERHGGRIWVESQPHKGSTFYFTIPDKSYNI